MKKWIVMALFASRTLYATQAIAQLSEGLVIPIELQLESSVAELVGSSELALQLHETVFIQFVEDQGLLFSRDGVEWGQFDELWGGEISLSIQPERLEIKLTAIDK